MRSVQDAEVEEEDAVYDCQWHVIRGSMRVELYGRRSQDLCLLSCGTGSVIVRTLMIA